jgi:hypothetical protein
MSQMGVAWGVPAIIFYNVLGAWSVYLLVWLYLEFKARALSQGKVRPEGHILQVHVFHYSVNWLCESEATAEPSYREMAP